MISPQEAARELMARRLARKELFAYIKYTTPKYVESFFSMAVCVALDQFILDVGAGLRPILILQAPPQHGKSEIVSRKLPAFLMGRNPSIKIGAASYSDALAGAMAQDVRRNIAGVEHLRLFPAGAEKIKYTIDRMGEFTAPGGDGSYVGVGVGAGLTGRPVDVGIIDDPTKDAAAALSPTIKEGHWNWYQSVFTSRLSENSGQIIMATSWAEDDLPGRIMTHFKGDPRLTVMRFPAINAIDEVGYDPTLPLGPLVPGRHSFVKLQETKGLLSDYWWSALYQQSPRSLGGNIFKEEFVKYYMPSDLPAKFDKVIASWDLTFKDTDGTDFVVGQVWGKHGSRSYLLAQIRERMSFTRTVKEVVNLRNAWPRTRETLIEDKANGPAVIDTLKSKISGLIAIEPDGSKLARAHAITSYWEAGDVWLPHPSIAPWVNGLVGELTTFPAAAHDDQVDALTQALRRLYPAFSKLKISSDAINKAMGLT